MNATALRLRKQKRTRWGEYARSKSSSDYDRYVESRNQLRKVTRRLRRDFETKLATELKTNPKAFWRYTNTRLKTKAGIDALENEAGEVSSHPKEKAEILNRYFSSVFVDEDLDSLPKPRCNLTGVPLDIFPHWRRLRCRVNDHLRHGWN